MNQQIAKTLFTFLISVILIYPNNLFQNLYINYIFITIVYITISIFDGSNFFKNDYIKLFFLLLFLNVLTSNTFSFFISNNKDISPYIASTLRYLCYYLLASIIINSNKNYKWFTFWVKTIIYIYSISLIIIILDSFSVEIINSTFKVIDFYEKNTLDIYYRAYGSYLSPISAGMFITNMILIILLALFHENIKNKTNKYLLIIVVLISFYCLITTASRTSIISLLVGLFVIFILNKNKIKIITLSFIVIMTFMLTGISDRYINNIKIRNENELKKSNSLLEGSGRIETLTSSIKLFLDGRTVLFGVGPTEYSAGDSTYSYAHNGFVSSIFCYGLIGTMLFIIVVAKTIRSILINRKLNSKMNFIRDCLLVYLATNATSFISSDGPVTHFWIINFMIFLFFIKNYQNERFSTIYTI